MKAISLWQPWASAMALGVKRIETRHWATNYRGPMAIHAAKRWTAEEREWLDVMRECGHYPEMASPPPLGAIVAIGRLKWILPTDQLVPALQTNPTERAWGNYGPGRYGWQFEDIAPLAEPIPYKGAQGLFDIPDEVFALGYRPPVPPPSPSTAPPLPPSPPAQGSLL